MKIIGEIREATLVRRLGLFTTLVEVDGSQQPVYLPNSGRLEGLLTPGRTVFLMSRSGQQRKTSHDLVAVSLGQTLVWVDSRAANELVAETLARSTWPQFQGYSPLRREVRFGASRLDFLLANGPSRCFLETKSVTLVRDRRALFPDAPTQRGTKQLGALIQAKQEGYQAAIVFVVQRPDTDSFAPNDELDPQFGRTLRAAAAEGVGVYAYSCEITATEIEVAREIAISF